MKLKSILKLINKFNLVQILDNNLNFIDCKDCQSWLDDLKSKRIGNCDVNMILSESDDLRSSEITILLKKSKVVNH